MYEWKVRNPDAEPVHWQWSREHAGCLIVAIGVTPEAAGWRQVDHPTPEHTRLHGTVGGIVAHTDEEADRVAEALARFVSDTWPQPVARDEQAAEAAGGR